MFAFFQPSKKYDLISWPFWLFFRYHFGLLNGCWTWCFYIALNKMATWMGKMMLNQGIFRGIPFSDTPIFRQLSSVKETSVVKKTDWLRTRLPAHELQSSPINTAKNQQHHPQFSTTIHFYNIRKYLWWWKKTHFSHHGNPEKTSTLRARTLLRPATSGEPGECHAKPWGPKNGPGVPRNPSNQGKLGMSPTKPTKL